MRSGQVVDDPGAVWEPPGPSREPADWAEFADAWEDSLLEAAACGDVGFAERMERSLWDRELWGWGPEDEPPLPEWGGDDARWVPADTMERLGRPGWIEARAAELNREHARFLAAVHQVGHAECRYDDRGHPQRDPFALDEVGAALRHSTAMAGSWLSLAEAVIERLPRVYEAMAAGLLDLAKARAIVDTTRDLPADLAGMVVARVLDRAPELANTELRDRLEVAAGELDPDWHRRREQAARSRVRLEFARNPAATGDVALRDIAAADQAAIKARADALAHALRHEARSAGLALGLPALRALVAQRVLDGTYAGLDDDALLVALTVELPAWHAEITGVEDPDDPDEGPDDEPGGGGPDDGPDSGDPDDGPDSGDPDDGPGGGPDDGPDGGGPDDDGTDDASAGVASPGEAGPGDAGPGEASPDDAGSDNESAVLGDRPALRAGTVELRLRLSTALGLDDLPGRIPGVGVVPAAGARRMVGRVRDGDAPVEWRVVLVDGDGRLEYVLLARPDPPRPASAAPARRVRGRVIVELTAPTTMLAALDPSGHPAWAGLIARAQRRLADLVSGGGGVGGPHHPATSLADAALRFPGAALERWIRVRDRSCIGVTCAAVAHRAEIDHTRAWAAHGRTVAGNLGTPCVRCHRLKHEGGWRLTQPAPGRFLWRSRLGASYTVAPRRVLEPPLDRAPRPDGRPRPVRGGHRPPPAGDSGWVEHPLRLTRNGGVPAPRPSSGSSRYSGAPDF